MTLADSHVKNLMREGASRAGEPASGSDWRVSPDAIAKAKEMAETYLRTLGEDAARTAIRAKRSTLKGEDVAEPATAPPEGTL